MSGNLIAPRTFNFVPASSHDDAVRINQLKYSHELF